MFLYSLLVLQSAIALSHAAAVQVSVPATPSGSNVVQSNFLGISFELSFMPEYFGNDTTKINVPMLNYLGCIRERMGANPVRVRVGGNSADDSPYVSEASSPAVQLLPGSFNSNDQGVTYNSQLWNILAAVSQSINGAAYLINIPLAVAPNASLSNDIRNVLGSSLDGMILGNEPDLYTGHKKRTSLQNYTVADYIGDFQAGLNVIGTQDTSGKKDVSGPGICCNWDLEALLQQGYLGNFTTDLKYVSVQHYPQNNCGGPIKYQLPWYIQHNNVVDLSKWQQPGIDYLLSQPAENRPRLINSEFNSASCGGVPFSPSFAVGSLWTIDYALQMATVGYSQAFIHTREAGIPYNLLAPPAGPAGSPGPWTTNAPYYAMLVMAEALLSDGGSIVTDLNLSGSMTDGNATNAAYAVYNAGNKTVSRVIAFNYGNSSTDFALPASVFSSSGTAMVKFLAAPTVQETTNISWGGETWGPGVSDGKSTLSPSWTVPNVNLKGCSSSGCSFTAPGPSLSMVFFDNAQASNFGAPNVTAPTSDGSNNGSNQGSNTPTNGKNGAAQLGASFVMGVVFSAVSILLG